MNDLITLSADLATAKWLPTAHELKAKALTEARAVGTVGESFTYQLAVDALREIKTILKNVEDARKRVKAPVLALDRDIDAKARTFVAELNAEANRLQGELNRFEQKQREERAAAEAKRVAEQRRIEEEARKAIEAKLKADQESQEAITEQELSAARAKKAEADAQFQAAAQAKSAVIAVQPSLLFRPEGTSVKQLWKFELQDLDSLHKARPDLCRIEASAEKINTAIRGGMRECAGLRIWQEIQTQVRT